MKILSEQQILDCTPNPLQVLLEKLALHIGLTLFSVVEPVGVVERPRSLLFNKLSQWEVCDTFYSDTVVIAETPFLTF